MSKLFWLSWDQPSEDPRPMTFPPTESILGWWDTGSDDLDSHTICAYVVADSEQKAKAEVRRKENWPDAGSWRFCEEETFPAINERFPLSDWMKPRFALFEKGGSNAER